MTGTTRSTSPAGTTSTTGTTRTTDPVPTAVGRRPLIGVLGGLGPAATLDFYAKVLDLTEASSDQLHVRLLIDADPEVPDRNDSVAGRGPSSVPALIAKAIRLKAAGAELLVMACNAAHAYQQEIEAEVDLPFISIVDEALKAAATLAPGAERFGIMATTGTLDAALYQRALAESGRSALTLDGESLPRFMQLVYRIKGGDVGADARAEMIDHCAELVAAGAQAIVAACTEVPLVLDASDVRRLGVPLVDATWALARAVVAAGS